MGYVRRGNAEFFRRNGRAFLAPRRTHTLRIEDGFCIDSITSLLETLPTIAINIINTMLVLRASTLRKKSLYVTSETYFLHFLVSNNIISNIS